MIIEKLIFHKHLERGEKILYSIHKHWIEILKPVLVLGFFGFVIPWGFYLIGFNTELFFWIALIWSVFAYMNFLYILVDWYSDVWLITDMGIMVIEWHGIFSNSASRLGYEDIEGIVYKIHGFWGTMLRYGNLTLRVMSGNNMVLLNANSPKKAELALARFQNQVLNKREKQDAGNLKALLSQMVAHHTRKN